MRKINLVRSVRLLLEVSALAVLAAWGVYAIVNMSVSPSTSSPSGLASQILGQISVSQAASRSGTTIPPNATAFFAMDFHDKTQFNASQTYPRIHPYPGYLGVVWGQFLPSDPDSTVSSFVRHYAVFSYWVTYSGAVATGVFGPGQLSSNSPTFRTYFIPSSLFSNGLGSTDTYTEIIEADIPGNYTLYIDTNGPGNSTAHVTMGYSSVSFAPSRPYFNYGVASLAVLGAYLLVRVGTLPRGSRKEQPQAPRTVQQPLPPGIPPD